MVVVCHTVIEGPSPTSRIVAYYILQTSFFVCFSFILYGSIIASKCLLNTEDFYVEKERTEKLEDLLFQGKGTHL